MKGRGKMKISEDAWLSEIVGYKAFNVRMEGAGEEEACGRKLRDHFGSKCKAFYFAKVDTTQIDCVRELCSSGFYFVDVNIMLRRDVGAGSEYLERDDKGQYSIVEAHDGGCLNSKQREILLGIAASCFKYSRFHLDPLIPVAIANEIKRRWIGSYLDGKRGEKLFVALKRNRPVGFIAALTAEFRGEPHGTIDLVGVGLDHQGQGVGTALARHFLAHCRGRNEPALVGTQAANIPSLRFYARAGFAPVASSYVFHAHVDAGIIVRNNSI